MKRHASTAAIAVTAAFVLAGCGTTGDEPDEGAAPDTTATTEIEENISEEHNEADITFAQMMIPHHQQAVEMSEILLDKDEIPQDVEELALDVMDAQGPEIDQMNTMLETWGEEPVQGTGDEDGHDGHQDMDGMHGTDEEDGHEDMSGMLSADDLQELQDASGNQAAQLYLEQMIEHHEGAVEMAEEHVSQGQNPTAVALADQVIEDQESEIETMETMID